MKKIALASLAVAGLVLAFAAGSIYWFPFQTSVSVREALLWSSGVRRVREGGLLAWERDGCRPKAPCRCVALVHGLGDSALTWDKVLRDPRASRDGLLVEAVDMPGTGGSPAASDYSIPALSRALGDALAARCPRWTIGANSLGGWSALTLALTRPRLVERLVLLSPAGVDDPTGRAEESARTLEHPTVENIKLFARRASFKERGIPDRAWPAALASILARPTRQTVEALKRQDLLDKRLPSLRVPTTLLWGEGDGIIPLSAGERMAKLIPGAELRRLPRCGHLPQQECPEPVLTALFGPPLGGARAAP